MNERGYVVTIEVNKKLYLMMTRAGGKIDIRGFRTEADGLRYFENAYARAHSLGLGWSTGAVLDWAETQPRIHGTDLPELEALVGSDPHCFIISNSGHTYFGVPLLPIPESEAFRASGISPRLV